MRKILIFILSCAIVLTCICPCYCGNKEINYKAFFHGMKDFCENYKIFVKLEGVWYEGYQQGETLEVDNVDEEIELLLGDEESLALEYQKVSDGVIIEEGVIDFEPHGNGNHTKCVKGTVNFFRMVSSEIEEIEEKPEELEEPEEEIEEQPKEEPEITTPGSIEIPEENKPIPPQEEAENELIEDPINEPEIKKEEKESDPIDEPEIKPEPKQGPEEEKKEETIEEYKEPEIVEEPAEEPKNEEVIEEPITPRRRRVVEEEVEIEEPKEIEEIIEEEVPLADSTETIAGVDEDPIIQEEEPIEELEIFEEEVPLASVPQTGENSFYNIALIISGLALVVLLIGRKKAN